MSRSVRFLTHELKKIGFVDYACDIGLVPSPAMIIWIAMIAVNPKALMVLLAAALTISSVGEALSAAKKKRVRTQPAPVTQGFDVPVDAYGVPIIMRGYRTPPPPRLGEKPARERAERQVRIPRGSSTYIPPPVPSPNAGPTPQEILGARTVQPYRPPPINSFGDRVIDAIHAYPLERGIGNNPIDQQQFIRQRANQ